MYLHTSSLVRHEPRTTTKKPGSKNKVTKVSHGFAGYRAITYGNCGGTPTTMKGGVWNGWVVGGGNRTYVFGDTFYPTTPALKTLAWGFIPISTHLDTYASYTNLHLYYESLPPKAIKSPPGGNLVEMEITVPSITTPFFLVSDKLSADEVGGALKKQCPKTRLKIKKPIKFNSTGNIQLGSVVQYYRGDTVAMILQGFEDAKQLPGNPQFPPNMDMTTWECLNVTVGQSVPLTARHHPSKFWWIFLLCLFGPAAVVGIVYWIKDYFYRRTRSKGKEKGSSYVLL